jgi:phospholipid transport system substrate-binding protein
VSNCRAARDNVAVRGLTSVVVAALLLVAPATQAQAPPANSASPTPAMATPAMAIVDELHGVLSANLLDGDAKGFNARLARVAPVVANSFDFGAIARFAMGRNLKLLGAAERTRLERLLEDLSAATYADRFSGDGAQARFVFVSQRPARGGRTVLRTRLERPGEAPVAFDYVLQETAQGPRIVNVIADGVSDLSLKRAQYAAVIRTEGVKSLLESIERQLLQLMQNGRSGG